MAQEKQDKPDTFDPTNQDEVAAYIDAHGLDAFREERHRQTGYAVTETTTAPAGK